MDLLLFLNGLLKYFFLAILTFYICSKSINTFEVFKNNSLVVIFSCTIIGIFYSFLVEYISSLLVVLLFIIAISYLFKRLLHLPYEYCIYFTIFSTLISFSLFIVSMLVASMFISLPFILYKSNPIILFIAIVIESLLVFMLFRNKRFRYGFSFLKYSNYNNKITIIGLILSGILFYIYASLNPKNIDVSVPLALLGTILIILGSYIWIKRSITLDYRERMRNREIDMLKEELETEKEKNVKLNEELNELAKINHKYSSRIKASEESVKKLAYMFSKTNNTEFSDELSDITKLIGDLSSQYSSEIASKLRYAKKLPSTNVKGVDIILSHMQKEALDSNIDFELKINCSVNHLIEKYIPQGKLETLLGDHIKDAIIAINSSNNKLRKIYVIFDIIDNCYQISFYDSGIDFEINTLINLGLEAITTHKDTGGNGFGFLTTFQTLKECKASLIIEEINFKNSNFSKCIHILFDNNSRYVIKTNRLEDFKKYNISDRIILEDTKTTS